jgi:hypothetical protein
LPQAQQWAEVLKSSFDPEKDADFCALLRDDKNLTSEDLINYDFKYIESLREEYKSNQFDNEELALEELLGEGDSANVYKGT